MSESTAEQTAEATEASEQTSTEATVTTEANAEKVDGEDALGDKGKKALDAMKAERNAAKDEARKIREEFEALRAQVEGKEAEYRAEQERRATEKAALDKANERILKAEVRAAAAGKLSDPTDALRFIDLSSLAVGDDGEVDATAISNAISDLIETKPYLAAQSGKKFQGSADGGTRNGANQPTQLTRSDLDRMTPEQITEARKAGRLDDLLGTTTR